MKLNYEELLKLSHYAAFANNPELSRKLMSMADEEWSPGTTMPPLNLTIVINEYNKGINHERKVRRVELLSAYSGLRGEKSYSKVKFVDMATNEELELSASSFEWRRV